MKKSALLDFCLLELNRKATAVQMMYMQKAGLDDYAAMLRAMSVELKEDIGNINKKFSVELQLDSNYSMTIGPNTYGIYETLEQLQEVDCIVEGGF